MEFCPQNAAGRRSGGGGGGGGDYLPSRVCIPDSIKMAFPFYGENICKQLMVIVIYFVSSCW